MTEANELTAELTAHREACAAKIKEGAETLCGIRTIRQELFQMAGEIPTIQDCEVSEWSRAAPSTGEDPGSTLHRRRQVVWSELAVSNGALRSQGAETRSLASPGKPRAQR